MSLGHWPPLLGPCALESPVVSVVMETMAKPPFQCCQSQQALGMRDLPSGSIGHGLNIMGAQGNVKRAMQSLLSMPPALAPKLRAFLVVGLFFPGFFHFKRDSLQTCP